MKASDLRDMKPEELAAELESLRRRIFDLRTQAVTEKLEDPNQVTNARRDVARVMTIMRERGLRR